MGRLFTNPLSRFDTHPRWAPGTQSARSRESYGKIGDCEQPIKRVNKSRFLYMPCPTLNKVHNLQNFNDLVTD